MDRKKLVIFPFNGNGIEALDCVNNHDYEFLGFVDDDPSKTSEVYQIFNRDILSKYHEIFILAVPGSPATFKERIEIISFLPVSDVTRFTTLIHPRASIGYNVKIGYNCLISAGAVLTSNSCIKNHVCVFPNSVIHHDVIIEDYTLVGSNVVIAGSTHIGRNCYVGSGTNIINGITVEDCSLIGLGSNITRNVRINSKMVGNPARDISILNHQ